ncbi:MAG TPA: hypothetical protein VGC14_26755 [Rhizobium sp.]
MTDIDKLIDRLAAAAVEETDVDIHPIARQVFADLRKDTNGIYALPATALDVYFPPDRRQSEAEAIAVARAQGASESHISSMHLTMPQMRESAWRRLNELMAEGAAENAGATHATIIAARRTARARCEAALAAGYQP